MYNQELQYHDRSGHPIVSLLPTTPYDSTKATVPVITAFAEDGEDGNGGEYNIENEYRCDWASTADSSTYMGVKKDVRKRLTAAAQPFMARRRWKVIELFTWTMEPVTMESGWDLLRKADRRRALAYICREQPDLVVAAWPCRYFSQYHQLRSPDVAYNLCEVFAGGCAFAVARGSSLHGRSLHARGVATHGRDRWSCCPTRSGRSWWLATRRLRR